MNAGIFGYLNACIIYTVEVSSENLRNLAPNIFYIGWVIIIILDINKFS